MGDAPIKWSKKTATWELGYIRWLLIKSWHATTWGYRRLAKPLTYHPIALLISAYLIWRYTYHPLAPLWNLAAAYIGLGAWMIHWPNHYTKHAHPRIKGTLIGQKYRWRPRPKLKANGLLNDDDPTPTISRIQQRGCVTTMWLKMSYGDDLSYWQERSSRIAQTYNADRAIINQYRRNKHTSLRPHRINHFPYLSLHHTEKKTCYRWLTIDLLTKDPFAKPTGIEYIHQHRTEIIKQNRLEITQGTDKHGNQISIPKTVEYDIYQPTQGDPLGPTTDGTPYLLDTNLSLLNVSITGGGKTNAERTYIYTGYRAVLNQTKENWGCDLARGVELNPIKHAFARVEDGKQGPKQVLQFWNDARNVLWERLDQMDEQGINLFQPTPGHPALDIYFDEAALLETIPYAEVRKAIYAAQSEILLGGRKAKIRIFAFTQRSKLDQFPLRDDYPVTHLGRVKTKRQVAMATDYDFYDRGGRASDINTDQPGIYYAETESSKTPIAFRFTETTLYDMQQLPQHPPSALWQPPPAIEQIFTTLPAGEPEQHNIPTPTTPPRRMKLHASRRPPNRNPNNQQHQPAEEEAMR